MIPLLSCKPEDVLVPPERMRKEFKKESLQELAASFKSIGQKQPGVCIKDAEGHYVLIAGERRLRAAKIAQTEFLFVLEADTDKDYLLEIEAEENLCRVNLTWQEECEAIATRHRVQESRKAKVGQHQSLDDTAMMLDRSRGSVHAAIELDQWAKEFAEIRNAGSKTDAMKVVKRYKAELIRNQMLKGAIENEEQKKGAKVEDDTILVVAGVEIPQKVLLDYNERIIEGSMESTLSRWPDEHFQLVLFDPPWGANLKEIRDSASKEDFEDDPEVFSEKVESWLDLLFHKMAQDSHLYFFFGIRFHELVYSTLEKVGFSTNRLPIIWYKQGQHVTRNPEIWPGRSYEPIAFARKGQRKLVAQGRPDVIITAAPTSTMKQSHPNAKHPDLYLELLERSAYPGDHVLDPMAGSGMVAVACEVYRKAKHLDWYLIEQKASFRELALENVIRGYSKVVNREPIEGRVELTYELPSLTSDFHELEVGSEDWSRFWKEHPEQQDEMLTWRKEGEQL